MRLKRLFAIIRRETLHILRDRTAFLLTVLSPVFLLVTMAYAFSVEVREVAVAVLDWDNSSLSRRYVQGLGATGEVSVRYFVDSLEEAEGLLVSGRAKAAVVIPSGFEAALRQGGPAPLQLLVEGTSPSTANAALSQIQGYTMRFAGEFLAGMGAGDPISSLRSAILPVNLRIRVLYNPRLKMVIGFLPALIAMVMGMPALAATTSLVWEKEHGTFEQLIVTPVRRAELVLGKLVPYIVSGLISVVLCVFAGAWLFDMPVRGSLAVYTLLSADFLLCTMGIALVISALTRSQQTAQIIAMMVFYFPGFFLSGIFYPIFSMAPEMKMEAYMVPTTHYVFISRGLLLKGLGLARLWPYALALFVMGGIYLFLAAILFKKKLT